MDLVRVPLTEKQIIAYDTLIDEVMKYPVGPERWRAAVKMMLKLNPISEDGYFLQQINKDCVEENRVLREQLGSFNKFGTSKDTNSSLREYLSMPRAMHLIIETVDPNAFKKSGNAPVLWKTFPEYRRSEAY